MVVWDFFYQLYFFGGTFLEQVNHHATSRSFMMAEIFRLGLPLANGFPQNRNPGCSILVLGNVGILLVQPSSGGFTYLYISSIFVGVLKKRRRNNSQKEEMETKLCILNFKASLWTLKEWDFPSDILEVPSSPQLKFCLCLRLVGIST